jgi:hypothetical protein
LQNLLTEADGGSPNNLAANNKEGFFFCAVTFCGETFCGEKLSNFLV